MAETKDDRNSITQSEWEVMRIIWTLGEVCTGQVIKELQDKKDWSDSTIKTLMRRLVQKGLLKTRKEGRCFVYKPTISQRKMMSEVTLHMMQNMCDMHKGEVLIQLLKEAPLSKGDIKTMQQELKLKEKDAPDMVPCNCLPSEKSRC